jgi:transposase-like protein
MVGMRAYCEDLRTRIVAAVEDGMPNTEAARLFGPSRSSLKRSSLKRYYCTLAANEEPLAPARAAAGPRRRTPPSRGCSKRT